MGQQFADAVHIHHWFLVRIVDGGLNLVLADLLAHLAGKLVVDGVTRARGDDTTFDGFSDEGHITNDVKQLMARTLIIPLKGLVLDIAQVSSIAMLHMQHICQHVETLLRGLALIDDDSVVEVAALDQISLKQRLDIANKDKGTGTGYLSIVSVWIIKCSKLRTDKLRLE